MSLTPSAERGQREPTRRARLSLPYLLAALAGVYSLLNAVRAVVDPVAFAEFFGTPLADPTDTAFLVVYASRSAVLGVLVLALVAFRETRALAVTATAAVLLPVADAVQTTVAGADAGTVARHVGIVVVLAIVSMLLWRQVRRDASAS